MRRFSLRALICAAGTVVAFALPASATQLAQQDLYLDALQSLSDGRHVDASETLIRMIENEPQHAGAWLDLAIIQCELGRAAEAERLFETIESRFSPPQAIRDVIAHHRANGCKGWQAESRTSVALKRGTDSNVNQGASNPIFAIGSGAARVELELLPEHLPQRDNYSMVSVEHLRDLTPNGTLGFVQFWTVHNDNLTQYDATSLVSGVEQPWRMADWSVRGTGLLGLHTLGGKLYQVQGQGQIRITPPLNLPAGLQLSGVAGLTHVAYPTLKNFDANIWELRGLLSYRTETAQGYASLGRLFDVASGQRPGGDRAGWVASLQIVKRFSDWASGEAGWTYQKWRSESPYSPGLIDEIRNQKMQIWRAALIFPIMPRQSIQVEIRDTRNNENISAFQYNSRQFQIGWQWQDF